MLTFVFLFRHFLDVAEFIEEALSANGGDEEEDGKEERGKRNVVLVNCVFGRSRSTTCVAAFLMLSRGWDAGSALRRLRERRPVAVNPGFLQQLADLDHKLRWIRAGEL